MKRFFLGLVGAALLIWGVHYWHRVSYGEAADSATNWLQVLGLILSGVALIFGPHLSPAVRLVLAWAQGRIATWNEDKEPVDDLVFLRRMRQKHPEQADAIRRLALAAIERDAPAEPTTGGST